MAKLLPPTGELRRYLLDFGGISCSWALVGILLAGALMLTSIARPTLRWATAAAAAALSLSPPSSSVASGRVFEPSPAASDSTSGGAFARSVRAEPDEQPPAAASRDGSSLLALGARILFVAGPNKNVRFRIDLRDGTLSTPSTPKLLEGVVDAAVTERFLFVCQTEFGAGSPRKLAGFDLETGVRIGAREQEARTAPIAAAFCTRARQHQSPGSRALRRLQNI